MGRKDTNTHRVFAKEATQMSTCIRVAPFAWPTDVTSWEACTIKEHHLVCVFKHPAAVRTSWLLQQRQHCAITYIMFLMLNYPVTLLSGMYMRWVLGLHHICQEDKVLKDPVGSWSCHFYLINALLHPLSLCYVEIMNIDLSFALPAGQKWHFWVARLRQNPLASMRWRHLCRRDMVLYRNMRRRDWGLTELLKHY